jgi:prepilin-type N-terminal cleavage/methylation domain-containing protein
MKLNLKIKARKKRGFTLIEVMYAIAILGIVLVGFILFSISSYQNVNNIVTKVIAQNLAKITMEDIKAQEKTFIDSLMIGNESANYPINGTIFGEASEVPVSGTYHVVASSRFLIAGINKFFSENLENFENGHIPSLEVAPHSSYFTKTQELIKSDYSGDFVHRYELTKGMYFEPVGNDSSGLVLFGTNISNFLREITITTSLNGSYSVNVKILLNFGTNVKRQIVEVEGLKTDAN